MGYYIDQLTSQTRIAPENVEAAFAACKAQLDPEQHGGGWSWRNGVQTNHFAWVDSGELARASDLREYLTAWHVDWHDDDDGGLSELVAYEDWSSKAGDEELLFRVLAPFIDRGSTMTFRGEEGEHYGWLFDGRGLVETDGADPDPFGAGALLLRWIEERAAAAVGRRLDRSEVDRLLAAIPGSSVGESIDTIAESIFALTVEGEVEDEVPALSDGREAA